MDARYRYETHFFFLVIMTGANLMLTTPIQKNTLNPYRTDYIVRSAPLRQVSAAVSEPLLQKIKEDREFRCSHGRGSILRTSIRVKSGDAGEINWRIFSRGRSASVTSSE